MFGRRAGMGGSTALADKPRQAPMPEIVRVNRAPDAPAEAPQPVFNVPLPFEQRAYRAPAAPAASIDQPQLSGSVDGIKRRIQPILLKRLDLAVASALPRNELQVQITEVVSEILAEEHININMAEQRALVTTMLNDMLGLGPLEPLLADETVSDIMVNGPERVFVERRGKLEQTDIKFRDDEHVMNIATRIVSRIGRRVDESVPLADARLPDGSRVNIIIPPLSIDGPSISIRKFSKKKITLDIMERQGNMSPQMARVLKIAGRTRLNILISGGTGSGKTTLLNAISHMIDPTERVVTIEDAAELQLQQPHVVRLETRPPNLEGLGEISQRDLLKNALRMRPDRIILGEIRSGEALDMLQAMNTGHDGSMGTIHANNPREALIRLENMVAMSGVKLPNEAVRSQIAAAIQLIVQVSRMRDGMRRVVRMTEVVGLEGDIITTQDLFWYEFKGEGRDGQLTGDFKSSGLRPHFMPRIEYYGLERALLEAVS
ncbi:MAG: CpaF family protein [Rhodospirillales bacterium]